MGPLNRGFVKTNLARLSSRALRCRGPLLTGVEAGVSVIFVAQASPLLADAIPCTPHINLFCTVSMTRNLSDEVVRPNSVL